MPRLRLIALAVLAACFAAPAQGAVVSNTQISYYTVGGTTPGAIFRAILNRGPRVSGARAIASIATRAAQDAGLDDSGGACRLKGYTITLDFLITRPRIANPGVLTAQDRASWAQMNRFIIAHENQHKQTWLGCAAELDRRMGTLTTPSCGQLSVQGESLWQQMVASCGRKQRAFDAAQARQLEALPFMQRARSGAD